jgi:hypothetical protein
MLSSLFCWRPLFAFIYEVFHMNQIFPKISLLMEDIFLTKFFKFLPFDSRFKFVPIALMRFSCGVVCIPLCSHTAWCKVSVVFLISISLFSLDKFCLINLIQIHLQMLYSKSNRIKSTWPNLVNLMLLESL